MGCRVGWSPTARTLAPLPRGARVTREVIDTSGVRDDDGRMRIGRTVEVFTAEPLVSPVPATARDAATDAGAPLAPDQGPTEPVRPVPSAPREPAAARRR